MRRLEMRAIVLLTIVFFATPVMGVGATEDIFIGKDFLIYRDFSDIKTKRNATVFFDSENIHEAREANPQLRNVALQRFGRLFSLTALREKAEYLLQVRMSERVNYAIRNTERVPAAGFVMVSICGYPIKDVKADCQNLTFYFFHNYARSVIFETVLDMWTERVVVP